MEHCAWHISPLDGSFDDKEWPGSRDARDMGFDVWIIIV
jgi:hypothetical protein